ncbi:MAG: 2-C-methyl-D-erythritol 4-phosphate cytidylyltransferase [Gammaproteobacteria bacterium]|nr:2-C-methyl-D-erythritol 4-phosphate cytidylyltransferase [Gammaproteobacteria bacterium]
MSRLFAIVPAAGIGRRMGGERPKQYLDIAGRSVLEHTLARIAAQPGIVRVVVPVAAHDERFAHLTLPPVCVAVTGGAERCHSVLAGLDALAGEAADDDWVLVHDAARPCVRGGDIARMVEELAGDAVGGILAVRVRDTLKQCAADGRIERTVPREGLWQAQTPQMFRYRLLREAIAGALAAGVVVTDEAEAVERAGHVPRVVAGHGDNLKITQPEDLDLAARILAAQG